jgi:hypothetical protein
MERIKSDTDKNLIPKLDNSKILNDSEIKNFADENKKT